MELNYSKYVLLKVLSGMELYTVDVVKSCQNKICQVQQRRDQSLYDFLLFMAKKWFQLELIRKETKNFIELVLVLFSIFLALYFASLSVLTSSWHWNTLAFAVRLKNHVFGAIFFVQSYFSEQFQRSWDYWWSHNKFPPP